MTTDPYLDPYADAVSPFDDAYADDVLYPMATAQPAPRTPRPTLRVRLADGMDEALRSPRWDQVRGLVLMSGGLLIAGIVVAVAVLVMLAGGVLVVRSVWEGL